MYGVHVTCHPTTSTTRFPEDNNIQTGKHQGTISAHRCSILSSLARSSSSVRSPRSKSCALCMASKSEVRSQSLVDLGGAAAEHGSAIQSPPNPNHVPAPKTLARGPWLHCAPIRCALKFEPIVTPPLFRRACACARARTHTHTHRSHSAAEINLATLYSTYPLGMCACVRASNSKRRRARGP